MNKQELRNLLPLKVMVTQEIIDKADLFNPSKCIGALSLSSVLPCNSYGWFWGSSSGCQMLKDGTIYLTTTTGEDLMDITEPKELTFIELK